MLIRYSDGRPAVAARKRPGQGEVLLFTTSVNESAWTDWFSTKAAFLPFIQVALNHLLEGRPQAFNRVAGEPLLWQAPQADAELAHDLVAPDGARLPAIGYPTITAGRPLLTAEGSHHPGGRIGGRIVAAGRDVTDETPVFAVAPDLRETEDLETLAPAQIDERLGFRAIHLTAGDDGAVFSGAERLKQEWTVWLLVGVLLLVLGEMALAWYCGRAW